MSLIKTIFCKIFYRICGKCFERWEMFYFLWTVLWGILTLHSYLLKGYNPMGINSCLCSLDNHFSSLPKLISKKHKKSYEYFPELLSVESKNLVVSWDKFVITLYQRTCGGKYCLRKTINFVPSSYRTIFCLCVHFVISLLLWVMFPTWTSLSRVGPHVFDLVDSSECCAHCSY